MIVLVSVKKKDNEDINSLLKRLKRKVEASGHLQELKDRRYFVKPSSVKRTQRNKIIYKIAVEKLLKKD
jgi:small subunit ribosomal protein S21